MSVFGLFIIMAYFHNYNYLYNEWLQRYFQIMIYLEAYIYLEGMQK